MAGGVPAHKAMAAAVEGEADLSGFERNSLRILELLAQMAAVVEAVVRQADVMAERVATERR